MPSMLAAWDLFTELGELRSRLDRPSAIKARTKDGVVEVTISLARAAKNAPVTSTPSAA
jgi:hypothetical protein